jgi:hypothetical protein
LYKAISSYRTSLLDLGFFNGISEVAQISGFVTKFESALTSSTPEVQITINCPYPYFRSRTRVTANMSGVTASAPVITDNVSTAPHGFRMTLTFTGTAFSWQWRKADSDWLFRISFFFTAGDVFNFSSEEDNKYVNVIRTGVTYNLASQIQLGSQWPVLFPGVNSWVSNVSVTTYTSVDYYTTNWGI